MRRLARWAAVLAAALALSAGVAHAQAARDPFRGQFGAMEIALSPSEALRQEALMGQALAGLQPQRPGVADAYVLTVGFWSDPVFESEASQAAAILAGHLGAEGRTLVLTNGGPVGGPRYPAASPYNLALALGQLGRVIDADEDLVVVFMTSHGSPDGSIAIRDQNRMSAAMRAPHLRDALNDAGIRNRVVIVSACYSGAFVAPLVGDRTIVLTAAASDRTSFGCQPENEWTFFGDAYFNHAVRGGAPLVQAFDEAQTLISQWEGQRNFTPSNPQRYVGAVAHDLLRRVERQARAR